MLGGENQFGGNNAEFSKRKRKENTDSFDRKKYLKRHGSDDIREEKYREKNPQPNYSDFGKIGAEFVDSKGREYIRVKHVETNPNLVSRRDEILDSSGDAEKYMFWIRIPISLGNKVDFPSPENEEIVLQSITGQSLYSAITDGVFYTQKRKTGYVILRSLELVENDERYDPTTRPYLRDFAPGLNKTLKRGSLLNRDQGLF